MSLAQRLHPDSGFEPRFSDQLPPPAVRRLLLYLVYFIAASLLAWRFLSSQLHYDSALIGLMAQSFLEGDFYPFFFGNNYMGTLDAVLAAPLLAVAGPTSLAVNIWPPLLYLAFMAGLHKVLARLFNFWGVLTGLSWLALPPAYGLFFAGEARTHYGLALFLCALLFLLTLKLWQSARWRASTCFAWGLTAGAAFWTNFLSAEVILPCGLFLVFSGWRRLGLGQLAGFFLGAALGASPLIAYNAAHGWPHLGLGGDLRLGPELNLNRPMNWDMAVRYLKAAWQTGLPVMLGLLSPHQWAVPKGTPLFWLYAVMAVGVALAALGLVWRSLDRARRPSWIPAAVLGCSLGAVVLTHYGSQVEQARPRYLLWVLFALPFCWAWWGALLGRLTPWLTLALALGLAVSNAGLYLDFRGLWGNPILDIKGGYFFQNESQAKSRLAAMRRAGIRFLYADEQRAVPFQRHEAEGAYELSFLAGGDPLVAELNQDKRPEAAARVDASNNPGFLWGALRPQAELLGLRYDLWQGEVFWNFREPANVERLLVPHNWRVTTLDGQPLQDSLWDANFRTIYVTANHQHGGDGFILDMGREEQVAGISLIPTVFWEVPRNVRVEAAGEDGVYRLLREVRLYRIPFYLSGPHPFLKQRYGRIECYFHMQSLRYLRFTHLGDDHSPWSVHEILVFGPGPEKPGLSWEQSMDLALQATRDAGIKRLYADAWPSAKAYLALGDSVWTLPANRFTDVYGQSAPRMDRPLVVDVSPGSGVLVLSREAEMVEEVLRNSGVAYKRHGAGRFVLFALQGRTGKIPLPIVAVRSPVDSEAAARLARGEPAKGGWASQEGQRPGIYLELDLGQSRELGWVELQNPNFHADFPRGLKALISEDGQAWRAAPIDLAGPIAFSGQVLYLAQGKKSLYRFRQPTQARHVRLELDAEDPLWWWSVERVEAFGP